MVDKTSLAKNISRGTSRDKIIIKIKTNNNTFQKNLSDDNFATGCMTSFTFINYWTKTYLRKSLKKKQNKQKLLNRKTCTLFISNSVDTFDSAGKDKIIYSTQTEFGRFSNLSLRYSTTHSCNIQQHPSRQSILIKGHRNLSITFNSIFNNHFQKSLTENTRNL